MTPLKRILVPFDFEPASRRALAYARGLAAERGAAITLVHVMPGRGLGADDDKWWGDSAKRTLQDCAEREKLGPGCRTVVLRGNPAESVAKYANEHAIDLIVLSGRAKRAWDGSYLGAVALVILKHARVPVLVVPA